MAIETNSLYSGELEQGHKTEERISKGRWCIANAVFLFRVAYISGVAFGPIDFGRLEKNKQDALVYTVCLKHRNSVAQIVEQLQFCIFICKN